jgi:hypothetical protein
MIHLFCAEGRTAVRLKVPEDRVLRRIFLRIKEKVTICWRRVLNEELRSSYSLPDNIRMTQLEHVASLGGGEKS